MQHLQVTVAQLGSRRHYLVPRVLARRGTLAQFVTDFWCPRLIAHSRLARALTFPLGNRTRAALSRRDDCIADELVRHFPLFSLEYVRRKALGRRFGDIYRAYCWAGKRFCELASHVLSDSSGAVYAFTSAALELFQAAHERGMVCILDHASGFVTVEQELYNEQWRRYPDWGNPREATEGLLAYASRQRHELELADLILVPSTFAKECLIKAGADPNKLRVLPLAFAANDVARANDHPDGPIHVLFVARQALLKGLPDLAEALKLLPRDHFIGRVVGITSLPRRVQDVLPSNLELVGEVTRKEVAEYYSWADVLVFPTVCDTFGFVILEAMAAGVPVIATPHSAAPDILRDGEDGIIVPVHSPQGIAQALECLARNRERLRDMKRAAWYRARAFDESTYGDRLIGHLNSLGLEG